MWCGRLEVLIFVGVVAWLGVGVGVGVWCWRVDLCACFWAWLACLTSSATQFPPVLEEIKAVASADVAHRKVFVRGLAWETQTEHLREAFSTFGDVQEGAVIFDKTTGKSRGYGFVTFVDMEAAMRAVEQQTITILVSFSLAGLATPRCSHLACLHSNRDDRRFATWRPCGPMTTTRTIRRATARMSARLRWLATRCTRLQ